jgi:hypothetical protein
MIGTEVQKTALPIGSWRDHNRSASWQAHQSLPHSEYQIVERGLLGFIPSTVDLWQPSDKEVCIAVGVHAVQVSAYQSLDIFYVTWLVG